MNRGGYNMDMTVRQEQTRSKDATELRAIFARLADAWRRETAHLALASQRAMHPAYQRIIGMGEFAIPLILAELRREPDDWFWALAAITGDNPVAEEQRGRMAAMAEAWLRWGREHGYNT